MIDPIYIFIIALTVAFLLSLFDRIGKKVSLTFFYLSLIILTYIPASWFFAFLHGAESQVIQTAGFKPPFSINLNFGLEESFFIFLSNLAGLLSGIYLFGKFKDSKVYSMMLFLMMIMGINGLIMTRDLFNLFVFMEITSISTYALIGIERNTKTLSAGFKYIIASGIVSSLFLIGTIYIYRLTGTLNIDGIISSQNILVGKAGFTAVFLVISAILIELKPFPANGWALDVYQSVNSGIVSMISVSTSGAMFFILFKLFPLFPENLLFLVAGVGVITFLLSNLMGLKQENAKRLLGYSSIAQMGLLVAALALLVQLRESLDTIKSLIIIIGGLFANHFFAKAGLFWLSGIIQKGNIKDWSVISKNPLLILLFGCFSFALIGLPPFPGFWAKWELIKVLISANHNIWVWMILLGSLLEAVYLLRWFGFALKGKSEDYISTPLSKILPVIIFLFLIVYAGFTTADFLTIFDFYYLLPILTATVVFAFDWLPVKFKGFFAIGIISVFSYLSYFELEGISRLFGIIFLIGSVIQLIATMHSTKLRRGFYPLMIMLILSLGSLLKAETTLQFFYFWELMTVSSYLLILMGKKAEKPALKYIVFSLSGAYLILVGFAFAFKETGVMLIDSFAMLVNYAPLVFILISIGFLIKSGALGFHIWLPESYAEADDDVSPLISSVLSKAGIFGLIIFSGILGKQVISYFDLNTLIGWLGVLTAFFGALMAIFQEDIKKLLAYSSMSQIGYMILSISLLSHLGWVTAIYLSFNHLLFKALLFLAVAGLISRVKTRKMYEMGGLIKKMPATFISVLIAIIALSGVPPLSGFGGKWLLYSSLIEKGWYLQAGLAFFASTVAFLYCYRLIHTMFLGQGKTKHQDVKEASLWFLIPQYILIMITMGISMFPSLILKPISQIVALQFASTLDWNGNVAVNSLGYWNGNIVMNITMVIFFVPLVFLLLRVKAVCKVKQFNIVYAAERPDRPETTHFAHNFFAPYQKALGFLVRPVVTKFWHSINEGFHTIGAMFRNIYTGNGQTYALHIIAFVVILYFFAGVK